MSANFAADFFGSLVFCQYAKNAYENRSSFARRRHVCRYSLLQLHCDWRFDRRMWLVPDEFKIFEFEVVDVFDGRIQFQPRQWPTFPGELLARLLEMVFVEMKIAERVNEIPRCEIDGLRHHHCEQRI